MEDINTDEFAELLRTNNTDYYFLDVREKLEFHTFNVGGVNIPLVKLQQLITDDELDISKDQPVIVICQRGLRSRTAKTLLTQNGYKNVRNLTGGLLKLYSKG